VYLSYVGIRVTNLFKSLEFYSKLLGLKEVARGDNTKLGGGIYVLLKDPKSKAKLELNWYPADSIFGTKYQPGEGLDHIAFRVDSVAETMRRLEDQGASRADLPKSLQEVSSEAYSGAFHVQYVRDPDGNWIELYDHTDPIGDTIPDAY